MSSNFKVDIADQFTNACSVLGIINRNCVWIYNRIPL